MSDMCLATGKGLTAAGARRESGHGKTGFGMLWASQPRKPTGDNPDLIRKQVSALHVILPGAQVQFWSGKGFPF